MEFKELIEQIKNHPQVELLNINYGMDTKEVDGWEVNEHNGEVFVSFTFKELRS